MKEFIKKYKHAWVLSYFIIYLVWFFVLGRLTVDEFYALHVPLDDAIPFLEIFIIPYYLWFPYIPLTIAYFFFRAEKKEYYQLTAYLFIGMTIALITYTIWPNGVYFRPELDALGRDNFLIDLTRIIYAADPGTNCCPSIHCFNSIGVCVGIFHCQSLKNKTWLKVSSVILSAFICLSTVFVKQHSVIDIFWAFVLAAVMYLIVYAQKAPFSLIFFSCRSRRDQENEKT